MADRHDEKKGSSSYRDDKNDNDDDKYEPEDIFTYTNK